MNVKVANGRLTGLFDEKPYLSYAVILLINLFWCKKNEKRTFDYQFIKNVHRLHLLLLTNLNYQIWERQVLILAGQPPLTI